MPNQLPGLYEQLQNFIMFLKRIIKAKLQGKIITVSDIERQQRLKLCGIEESYLIGINKPVITNRCDLIDITNRKCTLCGCDLHFKTKFRQENCPINKW